MMSPEQWMKIYMSTPDGLRQLTLMSRNGGLNAYWSKLLGPKSRAVARAAARVPQAIVHSVPASWVGSGAAGAAAAGAVPVVAMVGVYVALGSGYYMSRQLVKSESNASGFSQGFVAGLLGWEWRHVADRFLKKSVLRIDVWDEATNKIRVEAYNFGLAAGFIAGRGIPAVVKKAYLGDLRKLSGAQAGAWTAADQVAYVIDLAAAARKHGLLTAE